MIALIVAVTLASPAKAPIPKHLFPKEEVYYASTYDGPNPGEPGVICGTTGTFYFVDWGSGGVMECKVQKEPDRLFDPDYIRREPVGGYVKEKSGKWRYYRKGTDLPKDYLER